MGDNPQNPNNLTPKQKNRSIMFEFKDVSCWDITYDHYCEIEMKGEGFCQWYGGGNFLFAGDSAVCTGSVPPTSSPSLVPTSIPTAFGGGGGKTSSPTKAPSGVNGDPHFKTWSGEMYDFHGICDLVLLSNPAFLDGLGMDIFVRSKQTKQWSYISTAVIRIGGETFEVSGRKDGETFYINGKRGNDAMWDDNNNISGFAIRYQRVNSQQREYIIDVGNSLETSISFKTWKDFVRVDIGKATVENFGSSLGLMGSYPEGKRVGRDGKSILKDWTAFGQDWQVLPSDPKIFHAIEGPQHPTKCVAPSKTSVRRRLAKSFVSREDAELACASVSKSERDLCIFDVMATSDFGVAGAY